MTNQDKAPNEAEEQAEPRKLRWRPRHNHLAEPLPRDVSFLSIEGATLPWHCPGLVEVVRAGRDGAGSPGAKQCYAVGPGDVIVQAYERDGEEGTGMCLHFPRDAGSNDLWSTDDDALSAATLLKHAKSDNGRKAARDRFTKELARVLAPYLGAHDPVSPDSDRILVTAKEAPAALADEIPGVTRDMVNGLTKRKRDPLLHFDKDGPLRSRRFDLAEVRKKLHARAGSSSAAKNSPQPDQTRPS